MWTQFCWKKIIGFFITPKTKSKFFHVFWQCTKIRNYWNDICVELKKILGYELPKSCEILCNLTSENVQREDRYLLKILLTVAKKAITIKWCREDSRTLDNWLDTVEGILDIERLTDILRVQQAEFNLKWDKWTEYTAHYRDTTGD